MKPTRASPVKTRSVGRRFKLFRLHMATKEHLATLPRPDLYKKPDISVKVQRSLARRKAYYSGCMRPIYYMKEAHLSNLYRSDVQEKYIHQVFSGIHKIGQGCFGDVFRACSRENGHWYAIKVTNDTHSFIDFDEVRRLEKVPPNEHCIKYFMAWQEKHRLYIQMELCLTSLDKVILIYHHINERQCWEFLVDIALGLKYLHDSELIHLDIKPANIMITSKGVCKIGDFGLLVDLNELHSADCPIKPKRTVTVSEGDGKYVATEVLSDKVYSKAGDVFSLGLMMLEIASDVSLPQSGDDWKNIRRGALPQCYVDRSLTNNFRNLIKGMIQLNYTERPTVDDILHNPGALEIYRLREEGGRPNFMYHWQRDFHYYITRSSDRTYDIPAIQVTGPSPPRRRYPITQVSPLRAPLRELNTSNPESASDSNSFATPTGNHIPRVSSNVARRLF